MVVGGCLGGRKGAERGNADRSGTIPASPEAPSAAADPPAKPLQRQLSLQVRIALP